MFSDGSVAVVKTCNLLNTGFDQLKIVEFFGPQQEARQKETFHTITNFTLSHM